MGSAVRTKTKAIENQRHPSQELPWFDYSYGCITTKNPDEDVIRKMLSIAGALSARVQGDDGEIVQNQWRYRTNTGKIIKIYACNQCEDKRNTS